MNLTIWLEIVAAIVVAQFLRAVLIAGVWYISDLRKYDEIRGDWWGMIRGLW